MLLLIRYAGIVNMLDCPPPLGICLCTCACVCGYVCIYAYLNSERERGRKRARERKREREGGRERGEMGEKERGVHRETKRRERASRRERERKREWVREREREWEREDEGDRKRERERFVEAVCWWEKIHSKTMFSYCLLWLECVGHLLILFVGVWTNISSVPFGKMYTRKSNPTIRIKSRYTADSKAPVLGRLLECDATSPACTIVCSVRQCVAVCCSVLQCVAVLLQCVVYRGVS